MLLLCSTLTLFTLCLIFHHSMSTAIDAKLIPYLKILIVIRGSQWHPLAASQLMFRDYQDSLLQHRDSSGNPPETLWFAIHDSQECPLMMPQHATKKSQATSWFIDSKCAILRGASLRHYDSQFAIQNLKFSRVPPCDVTIYNWQLSRSSNYYSAIRNWKFSRVSLCNVTIRNF